MDPVILLLLLQASSVVADERCYSTASSQLELNYCAGASLEAADSKLAAFLRSYEAKLTPEQVELLHLAQLSWQRFRQASCEFETNRVHGGSAYPMVSAQCMASKAESRLSELEMLANCQSVDLDCPSHAGIAPDQSFKPAPLARLSSRRQP